MINMAVVAKKRSVISTVVRSTTGREVSLVKRWIEMSRKQRFLPQWHHAVLGVAKLDPIPPQVLQHQDEDSSRAGVCWGWIHISLPQALQSRQHCWITLLALASKKVWLQLVPKCTECSQNHPACKTTLMNPAIPGDDRSSTSIPIATLQENQSLAKFPGTNWGLGPIFPCFYLVEHVDLLATCMLDFPDELKGQCSCTMWNHHFVKLMQICSTKFQQSKPELSNLPKWHPRTYLLRPLTKQPSELL